MAKEQTRCGCEVPIAGMSFPRWSQCKRKAVTIEEGLPVCTQHTKAAQLKRKQKKEAIEKNKSALYLARLSAKNKYRSNPS